MGYAARGILLEDYMTKIGPSHSGGHVPQPKKTSVDREVLVRSELVGVIAKKAMPAGIQVCHTTLNGRVSKKHPHDRAANCAEATVAKREHKAKRHK